jgi:hypothetical protein
MSAHTPGPWTIWKVSDRKWNICEPETDKRHSHFASVNVGNFWHEEGKANARLIAAAPELLEALKWTLARVQRMAPHQAAEGDAALYEIAAALAAIAKATREQA